MSAQDNVPTQECITYDEVDQWWAGGEFNESTYPPSDWWAACNLMEIELDELEDKAEAIEVVMADNMFGWVETRDGQLPPTKDPEFSDQEWVAWDLNDLGDGYYYNAKILEARP